MNKESDRMSINGDLQHPIQTGKHKFSWNTYTGKIYAPNKHQDRAHSTALAQGRQLDTATKLYYT